MIFNMNDDGNVQSGGYNVNNIFMNEGLSLLYPQKGGSKTTSGLIVPAGLVLLQHFTKSDDVKDDNIDEEIDVVNDGLYEKLLDLVKPKRTYSKTKKNKIKKLTKNKTRKSRK